MKNIYTLVIMLCCITVASFGQVGINSDNSAPDPSAMLDVKSTSKGLLAPRVELTATNSALPVTSPAPGLLVYNTATSGTSPSDVVPGYYCWSGTNWIPVLAPQGTMVGDMQYWNGVQWITIPIGLPGQFLQVSPSNIPYWAGAAFATIITTPATNISASEATSGGTIPSDGGSTITARGICYHTAPNPTLSNSKIPGGTGTGTFYSSMSGLLAGTLYYVRGYATNSAGTVYGNEITFNTLPEVTLPTIYTTELANVTSTTAVGGGFVSNSGGATVTARGVCWSTLPNPTIANSKTSNGTGEGGFISNLTGLSPNTLYYIRAYATNSAGTGYGNELSFTTPCASFVTVGVSITASANPANQGTSVTFTAIPVNGGTSPECYWVINGSLSPINSLTKTFVPSNNDQISCILTSNENCIVGNPATSNTIFMTVVNQGIPCPGNPTVIYGDQTYHTVMIDNQCWFKENLNIGIRINGALNQANNPVIEKYCYNDSEDSCNTLGGLYQWNEMMQYASTPGARGICPDGWHIPTDAEWTTLITFLGGAEIAGGKMKATGTTHWLGPNNGATDISGFSALGAGHRRADNGLFSTWGVGGHFFSSTDSSSTLFWKRYLGYDSETVFRNANNKNNGFSVRCLKNYPTPSAPAQGMHIRTNNTRFSPWNSVKPPWPIVK